MNSQVDFDLKMCNRGVEDISKMKGPFAVQEYLQELIRKSVEDECDSLFLIADIEQGMTRLMFRKFVSFHLAWTSQCGSMNTLDSSF